MKRSATHWVLVGVWMFAGSAAAQDATAPEPTDDEIAAPGVEAQAEAEEEEAPSIELLPEVDPSLAPPPLDAAEEEGDTTPEEPPSTTVPPVAATGDVRVHFEPGLGLQITNNDGRFELIIRARAQFLASMRRPDGGDAGVDFELRRARIYFQGAVFDPAIRFTLQLGVSPSCSDMGNTFGGNSCAGPSPAIPGSTTPAAPLSGFTPRWSPLLDWNIELRHLREMNVRIGQQIPTFSRTFTISDASYQFIDRALSDAEFNLDRTFAIELRSMDFAGLGWLRYYAGVMSTQGRDMPFAPDLHLGYYVRVDVNPFGFFNDYVQGDLARNAQPRLSIGASYAFLDHAPFDRGTIGTLPLDGGTTDMHVFTTDFVFMWQGFSLTGELDYRSAARHPGTSAPTNPMTMMQFPPSLPRSGYGMLAIAGMMLGDLPLEVVVRGGLVRRIGSPAESAIVDQNELGGGLNWYVEGHPLKVSLWFTDVWRDDGANGTGQTLRLQVQATL
jgi:phosphate-selective porin OprO/OprP